MLKLKAPGMSGKLLNTIDDFLANKSGGIFINRKAFKWIVCTGFHHSSNPGTFMFLFYINNL